MNYISVFFVLLAMSPAFAHTTKSSGSAGHGKPSQLLQGELKPGETLHLEFSFPHCMWDSTLLRIQRHESKGLVQNPILAKLEDVRYVYFTGALSGNHKTCVLKDKTTPVSQVEQTDTIIGDPKLKTYYFIAVDAPTVITKVQIK